MGDLTPPAHTHRTQGGGEEEEKEEEEEGGRRKKEEEEEAPRPLPAARRGRRVDRVRRGALPPVCRRPAAIDAALRYACSN